jgi:hypothetical protein
VGTYAFKIRTLSMLDIQLLIATLLRVIQDPGPVRELQHVGRAGHGWRTKYLPDSVLIPIADSTTAGCP